MLDDLLGRTELREQIQALEEQVHHLERELDAERDRRADAVSARQVAEERVNRLEDRIAGLEGRLEAAGGGEQRLSFRRDEHISGRRCESVLARIQSIETDPESALTAMVGEDVPTAVEDLLAAGSGPDRTPLVTRAAPCLVVHDDAGIVSVALRPPVPPEPFVEWKDRFRIERSWFLPTGRFVIALVRADVFALGEYRGAERVGFEGFESDVRADHSKGGFSQGRFERRRDEQIADHLERCRAVLADVDIDRRYVVGDRQVVAELADLATATAAVDATGEPEAALDDAFEAFWATRMFAL